MARRGASNNKEKNMPTSPRAPRPLLVLFVALALVTGASVARADDFNVDDGGWSHDAAPGDGNCKDAANKCTLNAAIEEGNVRSGSHTITFGVPVVILTGSLAQLRAPFTITGGFPVRTIVNGNNLYGCFSLTDSGDIPTGHFDTGANGSTIQNLVIQNCNSAGISANGHGFTFKDNLIGTDPTGTLAVPNHGDGISISASRVYTNQSNQMLQDLFNALPAQPLDNAQISGFASQFETIMANLTLGPVEISGNVISGNDHNGIEIFSENLAGVWVKENFIGTDITGNLAIPNQDSGIHLVGSPFAEMIGPGNVISGNAKHGVHNAAGPVSMPSFLMGNRIGLAATNAGADIGNGLSGVYVDARPETTLDGRINPSGLAFVIGPANVISDNNGANNNAFPDVLGDDQGGIVVTGQSEGVPIKGNAIGTGEFPPGTPVSSLAYGNAGDGIIVTVSGITIGGPDPANANIVSANARHGIVIRGSGTHDTTVLGNYIGVHPAFPGDLTLGNDGDGIHVDAASTSFIGGSGATDYNTIAGNGRNGVKLRIGGFSNGWGHLIQRNRIYGNAIFGTGIGIDLDHPEDAANDAGDGEIPGNYANLDQSQPVICTGTVVDPATCGPGSGPGDAGGSTSVHWTLVTHGAGSLPTTYRVEFFKIDAPSVNAATSMEFLGEQTVSADLGGVLGCPGGLCTASIPAATAGSYVVMTATDATEITNTVGGGWLQFVQCLFLATCNVNNTSEFSNVVAPATVPVDTSTAVTIVEPQGSGNATPTATSVFGQPVQVTVSVTAASGLAAPTGSVTVTAGAGSCIAALGSPSSLTSTGSCTLAPAPLASASAYPVVAAYAGTAEHASSSSTGVADGSLTVNPAATTTAIASDTPDPSIVGASYLVAAGVTPNAPGAGTPTGTITVSDGTDNCVITLPATSCNLTSTTTGAPKTLTAQYGGDANFATSASTGVSHTVDAGGAAATNTTVKTVAPATSVYGQTIAVTVEVTSATTPPDGSALVNAGTSSCSAALAPTGASTSGGSCNLAPALPVSGAPYPVTAAYGGSAAFAPSVSSGLGNGSATVNAAATATAISAHTPDPSNVGAPIQVTAGVAVTAPGAGTPTGTITVTDGTDNCVITLPATTCNLTPTTSGAKALVATYSGDANFAGGTSPGVAHTVNAGGAIATSTSVTLVNPASAVFGQAVAVTVSVTALSGSSAPTGNVTAAANGSNCLAALGPSVTTTATGTCNLAPAPNASGSAYTVTGAYAGNATFAASSSSGGGNGALTVNAASTTTTIGAHTPNPSNVNAAIAVTATVAVVAPGSGTPSGTVTVSDGSVNCVITLPATNCNLTPTTTGAKTLTAAYGGSANFLASASAGIAHSVVPGGSTPTTTVVSLVSPASAVFGQVVAVTTSVTAGSGGAGPTGSVTLQAGGSSCVATLDPPVGLTASGTCNLAPAPAVAGSPYTVTATYAGTATFAASGSSGAGNGSLTVSKASTTPSISGHTPNPSNAGSPVAVTAGVVVVAPGAGTPSGTMTVSDGVDNCVITLPATSCNLTLTTAGPRTLTANYAGDANFQGNASAGVAHTVNSGGVTATTTTVASVVPASAVYGEPVSVTAEVTALTDNTAPNGNVTLTAGGSSCVAALASPVNLTSSGSCVLAPPLPPSGSAYAVVATYPGTPTFGPSASSGGGNGSVTVAKAGTTTAITAHAPDPALGLVPILVTVAVAPAPPGSGVPTGTVDVTDGTATCTLTLPATTCNLVPLTVGPKTLTATYAGDAFFATSSSAGVSHTVNALQSFTGPTIANGVTGTATLVGAPAGCTMIDPAFIAVAPLTPPPGVTFPYGLFDFSTSGCGAGGTITVQIVYSQPLPAGAQYLKYGPTPGSGGTSSWYAMPGASVGGTTVTFSITDGLIGDDDVTANGTIVDQGGPAVTVKAIDVPALDHPALLALLALLVSAIGFAGRRRAHTRRA